MAQVSATLATTVSELPDEDDGGKLRAATADDYASMQYRLVPRDGSKATPSFDKAGVVNVRTWPDGGFGKGSPLSCERIVLPSQQNSACHTCGVDAHVAA